VAGDNKELEAQKEGILLIGQLEEVARDVRYNAERLNAFNRDTRISRWTHNHHLNEIKSLVNNGLQPALARLIEIQPQLPDWKQDSTNQMLDSAKALAADTSSAILNKNETMTLPTLLNTEYRELVTQIVGHADTLVKTSDAAGAYASAHLKATKAGLKVAER
jgi:hypothetical protein